MSYFIILSNGVADRLKVINTSIYHSPLPLPTITQFDHVISNPPYIKSQHIPHLQPEVSRSDYSEEERKTLEEYERGTDSSF